MPDYRSIAARVGMEIVNAGAFVGRKAVEVYRMVDPDVMRHIKEIPLLSYTLFVSKSAPIEPGIPDGHSPLIFVHGLGGDRGNFLPMAWYLSIHGRKRSYRIHFDGNQSLNDMADDLVRFIRDVRMVTGEDKVEIVTHSLGGNVARLALDDVGTAESVKTLIMLGAPYKGTYAARYANTETLRCIRPDCDMIKKINAAGWPKGVRGYSFWSANDLLVVPGEHAIAEGTTAVDMTPFTHYSYLISPRCWAAVAQALRSANEK